MADGGQDGRHSPFPGAALWFYEAQAWIMLGRSDNQALPFLRRGKFITALMGLIVSCGFPGVNVGFHISSIFLPTF